MSAKVLQGAEVAQSIERKVLSEVECLKGLGVTPTLAILRIGEKYSDLLFERRVAESAARVGINVRHIALSDDVSQREVILTVQNLNEDLSIHGILMCRPLPEHIDEYKVRNMIDPAKDTDGITDVSLARMFVGSQGGYTPCTAQACMEILDHYSYDLKGKNIIVVGRSLAVGRPVAMLLLERSATVTIAHSQTENLIDLVRQAEIVVTSVGSPHMFGPEYFVPGQTVIDVGTNFVTEKKLIGDVDFDAVQETVAAITPVPGGVGTVTSSTLVKHVMESVKKQFGNMEISQNEEGVCNITLNAKK